jgi:hypothetical protein
MLQIYVFMAMIVLVLILLTIEIDFGSFTPKIAPKPACTIIPSNNNVNTIPPINLANNISSNNGNNLVNNSRNPINNVYNRFYLN